MVTQVGVLLYSGRNINSGSRKEVYHEDLIEEEELPGGVEGSVIYKCTGLYIHVTYILIMYSTVHSFSP